MINHKNRLVKTTWAKVRDQIHQVNPEFAELVDPLNPKAPLYLAYYSYGQTIGDEMSMYLPDNNGSSYRLDQTDLPSDLMKNLAYGADSSPLAMVVSKQIEYLCYVNSEKPFSWQLYKPGHFFPILALLYKHNHHTPYTPNAVLRTSASAESAFMLPSIKSRNHHLELQDHYNLGSDVPITYDKHHEVFTDIIKQEQQDSDWQRCLLFFSESWFNDIRDNKKWACVKNYLLEQYIRVKSFKTNECHFEPIYAKINNSKNLKPNPYLADTIKYLINIAVGAAPGYAPAVNEEYMPIETIQKAYVEAYGLSQYPPTIMVPHMYNYHTDDMPVYYSLNHPAEMFSPKSTRVISIAKETEELMRLITTYLEEFAKESSACRGTELAKFNDMLKFRAFHSKGGSKLLTSSKELPNFDKRFSHSLYPTSATDFPYDAVFCNGCISIQKNI